MRAVRTVTPSQPAPNGESSGHKRTLYDRLKGKVGLVEGTGEAWSEDCGRKFADDLVAGRKARP